MVSGGTSAACESVDGYRDNDVTKVMIKMPIITKQ